jgi:hypothetical protein
MKLLNSLRGGSKLIHISNFFLVLNENRTKDLFLDKKKLLMQGKLREATDVYAPVLEAAGEWQYFAIQALIGLGNIARERNELDTASAHFIF